MEKFLGEDKVLKAVVGPVSIQTSRTGERVKIAGAKRVSFIINVGVGSGTNAHSFVLKQHDAASSGNSHDLEVAHPYYHKVDDADAFTKVDVTTATATYDLHTIMGEDMAIVVFEVLAEDLRSDCKWVSLDVGAAGAAQIGSVLAVVDPDFKPAYEQVV